MENKADGTGYECWSFGWLVHHFRNISVRIKWIKIEFVVNLWSPENESYFGDPIIII